MVAYYCLITVSVVTLPAFPFYRKPKNKRTSERRKEKQRENKRTSDGTKEKQKEQRTLTSRKKSGVRGLSYTSELNIHIWNANWPMKSEAKMVAHGEQFWTSVSVFYAGLYVSFSLPRDFLPFLKIFLIENIQKTCLQKIVMSLRIANMSRQSQT